MTGGNSKRTVGALPDTTAEASSVPAALTWLTWSLFLVSVAVLLARVRLDGAWEVAGVVAVDGLTALLWVVATFFGGIVLSYSRRYMAGSRTIDQFFGRVFAFTATVAVLVAADHLLLFGFAWLVMGLLMAGLIGHVDGWPQAQAAASYARRYFLASSAVLAVALATLWWTTGATTVSGVGSAVGPSASTATLLAAGALLLAAAVQSALVPFHTWLLSSMTAPTPASALMHAGFVNAGGVLLLRFAPVVTLDPTFMLLIVAVGAASALLGKLLKSVQVDAKSQLGCSTTGQMGLMIMQAGLGFFGAAITHLVLHGFYKAYMFLSAGEAIEQTAPGGASHGTSGAGVAGVVASALAALAGGALFALLTGKGTEADSGLVLTGLIVLTTLHATRHAVANSSVPATYRYGAVPLVFLPAIAVYGLAYTAVETVLADVPSVTAPAELTVVHGVVGAAFLAAYLAVETGAYRRSERLYVALVNAAQAPSATLLTSTEDYNEY